VLAPPPALVIVLRPRMLRRDALYGPLLRRVLQLARERSGPATLARTLDAVEDADEVLVGVQDAARTSDELGNLVLVLRGVRADLDPANLVDDQGRRLWTTGPSGRVRELVLAGASGDDTARSPASLFELPDRTWVIATGKPRVRVRDALDSGATALATSAPFAEADLSPDAPFAARLNGPSLVSHVGALQPPAQLAPVGRSLIAVTMSLSPGPDAVVRATFTYSDEDAVGPAQATVRRVLDALSTLKPDEYGWLRTANVEGAARRVEIRAPLPKELLSAFSLAQPRPVRPPSAPHDAPGGW
jgi:hypothetical protein